MRETNGDFPLWTDLGRKLGNDKNGAARGDLMERISAREDLLRKALEKGLRQKEGALARKELQALHAAARIVDIVWYVARHAEGGAARS